jgi:catechol 2,3-dioxygenase-like lactoylglutathione lyase family enzyme
LPLEHMQHFLVQSEDLEKTKDWYVNVLGLKMGFKIELNFANAEARGRKPQLIASDLKREEGVA